MTFVERLRLLDRLHHLIRRRSTGSPRVLAAKLDVSERTVYNLLDDLRALGAEVAYCHLNGTYYYEERIELRFIQG